MILAAGRGERMRPLSDSCPKPLLEVKGKRLIEYHLEALARAGIESVVINVSWLATKIQQFLGDGRRYGIRIDYSLEPEALETAGGIIQALDKLDDEFILVNGDIFSDYDFTQMPALSTEAHLVLVNNPEHNLAGDFAIEQGYLSNRLDNRYTYAGIACYRKTFFAGVSTGRSALPPMFRAAAELKKITAELYQGVWSDVGTPQRLESLNRLED